MKRNEIKPNRFRKSICPLVMIGDYPIVMKGDQGRVVELTMPGINFINLKETSNENNRYCHRYFGSNRCFRH